jgi:hypothetical protein
MKTKTKITLKLKTKVKAGYTNGGVEHEDTWDAQR